MKTSDQTGVLFDLDGVLLDTEGTYAQFWTAVDERYPTGVPDFALSIKGSNLQEILGSHFPDAEVRQQVWEMLDGFQQRMRFDLFPGAVKLVEALRKAGIPCCVVTSSDQRKMEGLGVQHPDLLPLFDGIVTGDMVSHAKPHPECFLKGAGLINRDIGHCIVIEDSLKGLQAGRAAGARVVGLTTTYGSDQVRPLCDLMADDISQITLEMLLSL
ncbi:MAG: HAD family phosphatase [Muribaculaceae bacterium]|nr:HAD family phosphatase [Muribaculaceae bacterium]